MHYMVATLWGPSLPVSFSSEIFTTSISYISKDFNPGVHSVKEFELQFRRQKPMTASSCNPSFMLSFHAFKDNMKKQQMPEPQISVAESFCMHMKTIYLGIASGTLWRCGIPMAHRDYPWLSLHLG
jgi:hypothetical protein